MDDEKINILLVDDQPAKLLSYEIVLRDLGENLLQATSPREVFAHLLKTDIAIVLMDVSMPELDGFQLAAMIREHPRFQETAIIFVSAVHLDEGDFLRGYEMGAVDYVPVPVIPAVLRAKVRVFAELHRKTRQLGALNQELERRVVERTAALEASTERLRESERRRTMALTAGQMGSWDWDVVAGDCVWDESQCRIAGIDPATFTVTAASLRPLVEAEDWQRLATMLAGLSEDSQACQAEFRVRRPDGELRWCFCTAAATTDDNGRVVRISGVTSDVTERKLAEERQTLLAREVDHRAKNALALVQSIVRLSRGATIEAYIAAVEGRISALSRAHALLAQSRWQGAELDGLIAEELAPFRTGDPEKVVLSGRALSLPPRTAQAIALAVHELATNAAKYGALSHPNGRISLAWESTAGELKLDWRELGGPRTAQPATRGFGLKVITASIERELGGAVAFNWHKEGLSCTIRIRLGEDTVAKRAPPIAQHGPEAGVAAGRPRVMLVEDEVLVGMMMCDVVADMDFLVAGPFTSTMAAVDALQTESVCAAVLDVNLAGEMVYPLADLLVARNIPFLFVTGYEREAIDPRFANIAVLEKPLDRTVLETMLLPLVAGSAASGMLRADRLIR